MINQKEFGKMIKVMREKKEMTQLELASALNLSDRTISKWETGRGYPDFTFLEKIASLFSLSVNELLSGTKVSNLNVSANMMKASFYVCPVCGNTIVSTGEASLSCHGITLEKLEKNAVDEEHAVSLGIVEDDYFVSITHPMTKENYISFIAALSSDRVQIVKLYPEQNAEARVRINGVREILFYSNTDGLYAFKPKTYLES